MYIDLPTTIKKIKTYKQTYKTYYHINSYPTKIMFTGRGSCWVTDYQRMYIAYIICLALQVLDIVKSFSWQYICV